MCVPTDTTSSSAISIEPSIATDPSNTKKGNRMIKRRRLTFASEISKVTDTISLEDYTDEEKKRCWWSVKEVSASRKQRIHLVLTARREHGQHFVKMIDDSYKTAQSLSTKCLNDKAVDDLFQEPSNYLSKLEAWTLNAQGCRGLERYISYFQYCHRLAIARETREILLEALRRGSSSDEGAEIYAEQSLSSRLYALWMGHADHSSLFVDLSLQQLHTFSC
jgi:hypothetical protein